MKNVFLFVVIFCQPFSIMGQDVIRLQYGDSIPAKVTEVGRKDIKYIKQSYPDGPEYSVPNRKVIAIKHHNGEVEKLNQDKRFRTYRAGFSLMYGGEVGNFANDSYNGSMHIGIGHEGIFRFRGLRRIGFLYSLNLQVGQYGYYHITENGRETRDAYYAIPAIYTGVEYKHPVYKDFGVFTNLQIGSISAYFFKPQSEWDSPYASYIATLGIFVREVKWSIRYNTGVISFENGETSVLPENSYRLHMIQFSVGIEF